MQNIYLKRGSSTNRMLITPAAGEPIWDTTTKSLWVGDGTTVGGIGIGGPYGFGSQVANTVFAAPNGSAGAPTFRSLVAGDIPILNQNTTGTAASITGVYSGSISSSQITTGLGFTPYNATNPASYISLSAITDALVLGKLLTGFSSSAGTVSASDTILQAFQKLNGNDELKAPLASPVFTGTPNLPTGTIAVTQTQGNNSTSIATTAYTDAAVNNILAASDAMVFKGTVGTGGTFTIAAINALTVFNAGWSYKIIEAGTVRGFVCQVGDILMTTVNRASAGTDADFTVIQTNIDGAVTGPGSSVNLNIAVFNSTTGKVIMDGGATIASLQNQNIVQTITLTGAVTGSGTGTFATTFKSMAATSILANATAGTAVPTELAASADGQVLRRSAGILGWGSISLTDNVNTVTGLLAIVNGGTGNSSAATNKGIVYAGSTTAYAYTAAGSWDATNGVGQLMSVNASGIPTWTNVIDGGSF